MPETSEQQPSKLFFLTSPVLETVFALNALAHPERRQFLAGWAAEVEEQLTAAEQKWLAQLRKLPELFHEGDLVVQHRCFHDLTKLTTLIGQMSPDAYAAFLLGEVVTPERVKDLRSASNGAAELRSQYPWLWNGDEAVLATIVYEAEQLKEATVGLLPRVWALGIEPMLPRLEPLWEETIAQAETEAQGKDPKAFTVGVFGKPFGRRYGPEYVFPQYGCVPTFFFSPMRVALFEPSMAVVTLDCRLGPWTNMIARDRVVEGLRAIAEPSRLEILRVLAMDKGFNGWVAGRLKLNPATVTHHMNLLRQAGLLKEVEGPPGAAKYYRTDREALQRLVKLLQDFVDSNIEPDWEGAKR